MPENWDEEKKTDSEQYVVPGRLSLDELHKQEKELLEAKQVSEKNGKGPARLFNAMSMYSVAMDFALILAIPLIVFIYLGRWADKKYGTSYLVIVGILLAIATSSYGIYKQITKLSNLLKKK